MSGGLPLLCVARPGSRRGRRQARPSEISSSSEAPRLLTRRAPHFSELLVLVVAPTTYANLPDQSRSREGLCRRVRLHTEQSASEDGGSSTASGNRQGPVAGRPDARTLASANRRGGHLLILPEQVCKCREQRAWCFMTTFEAQ